VVFTLVVMVGQGDAMDPADWEGKAHGYSDAAFWAQCPSAVFGLLCVISSLAALFIKISLSWLSRRFCCLSRGFDVESAAER
jgi:hypothetical protein